MPFRFSQQNLVSISQLHVCRTEPTPLIFLYSTTPNSKCYTMQIMVLSVKQFSSVFLCFLSPLAPHILLGVFTIKHIHPMCHTYYHTMAVKEIYNMIRLSCADSLCQSACCTSKNNKQI